jgi:hypothetical protein
MKKICFAVFCSLLLFKSAAAQKITGGYFGYFKETSDSGAVAVGNYTGAIVLRSYVTENPQTAKKLITLLKKLRANGSEDINKCFIPRHIIQLYNGDELVYSVLVCFECGGIRFSNETKTTGIKSAAKREALMKQLKALFKEFHFEEKE